MLQTFIMQNPTAEELHFLLSVRAQGSAGRGWRLGGGEQRTQGLSQAWDWSRRGLSVSRDHRGLGQVGRAGAVSTAWWQVGQVGHSKASW